MKLYDRVKYILEDFPITRNSDKELIWIIWEQKGLIVANRIDKKEFMKAPTPESITRARRKVQENHSELQATEPVRKARKLKEETKGTFIFREDDGQGELI